MKDMASQVIRSIVIAGLFGMPVFNIFKDVHVGLAGFLACIVAILMSHTSIFSWHGEEIKTNFHKNDQKGCSSPSKPETVFDQAPISNEEQDRNILIPRKEECNDMSVLLPLLQEKRN